MTIELSPIAARVLGSLVEKEITTPEYYPLSLNALANACNQKNNREPVTNLDEGEIRQALHRLEDDGLAGAARGTESRVAKYEHHMQEVFNFTRGEIAVMCVLLLRGPQTPGELRGRTERMHRFEELSDVQSTLQRLMQREPPLVMVLPRQPGTKEARYAHLLSGEVTEAVPSAWRQRCRERWVPPRSRGRRTATGSGATERAGGESAAAGGVTRTENRRSLHYATLRNHERVAISANVNWNVFLQNSHKIVILRVCDFIGFAKKSTLKTKRLGASKGAKNQKSHSL